jgi:hypothetical protein
MDKDFGADEAEDFGSEAQAQKLKKFLAERHVSDCKNFRIYLSYIGISPTW